MRLRVPHTFVLLFALVVLAAIITWLIPAGELERVERDGRVVRPGLPADRPCHRLGTVLSRGKIPVA